MIFMIENEPEIIRVKRNSQIECDYEPDNSPGVLPGGIKQNQTIHLGMYNGFMSECWKVVTHATSYDCRIAFYDTTLDTRKAEIRCDKDMLDNLIRLLQRAKFHMDMSQLECKMRMKNEPN